MTGYLKSHRWLAGAAAVAVTAALVAAACGGSSKLAKDKSASGVQSADSDSALAAQRSAANAPAPDTQLKSYTNAEAGPQSGSIGAAPADAGSGSGAGGGSDAAPSALPSTLDRKIIQTATLKITTDDVAGKFEDVRTVATKYRGFVASSTFGNTGERQTAAITIRVPGSAYEDALNDLRGLGDVKGEDSGANDVTEEYTDLQSRLRNLKATEDQYIQFLLRAQSINEVLTVQDRLNVTRSEIEQVQGRINLVEHQTDLATITVHLDPPVIAKTEKPKTNGSSSPLEVARDSFQASLAVLLGIATVALAVAAFSWWIVPLALAGAVLLRRQLRGARERQSVPPASAPVA